MSSMIRFKNIFFTFVVVGCFAVPALAQEQWEEGELEAVEIEIIKERQITLPPANRNFEKIPPRASEPIKPPMQYDFRPFSFQTSQINPAIRPLRLKQTDPSKIYGGHVSAGYGNYASPYLEGFFNTTRDKNKLVGAHAYYNASAKGPVDDRNSGSGNSGVSLYGRSFNKHISLSGDLEFENRSTHFYGYAPGTIVEASDIRQSYNNFGLSAAVSNTRNTDFTYRLGAGFSYMTDRLKARETEVNVNFNSAYSINEESSIGIKADYALLSRTDEFIEANPRSLFSVNPTFVFYPVEDLKMSAGIVAAFENDSIDTKDVHAYPDIRVSYPLSPSVDFIAALTGGIEKVSLQSLSRENLWIQSNIPVFHTNKLFDLQLAINARMGNKVSLNGGFSFAALKNLYFFVNDSTDQSKFVPEYDNGTTKRTNIFASIGFAQTEAVKLMLRGDVYTYGTDEVDEAWHRPTYKLTGDVSFNIYKKLLIDLNVIAQGGMIARRYVSPGTFESVELDPAFDLNARLEYIVSDKFSVFVQGNNLTSNQYPLFMNYPVRSLQVLGGITIRF